MSYVRIKVHADELATPEIDLIVPQNVLGKANHTTHQLTVQFGKRSIEANVKSTSRSSRIYMRPALVNNLYIPKGVPLLVRFDASRNCLILGPLVGILLSTIRTSYSTNPFGFLTPFLEELADTSRKRGGLICAFTLEDVDWETETVRCMIRKDDVWQRCTLPLPQCIYNRLTSRNTEKSEKVNAWIERCKKFDIPFFNEHFLNKWHVHKALAEQAGTHAFLPKTVRYRSMEDLQNMLQEFRTLYVKPANGSMGKGIYRLKKTPEGYQCKSAASTGTRIFKDIAKLHEFLWKRIEEKQYILQKGLSLIGIENKPTDFRVLVQKNHRGVWAITSLVARTGRNTVVSNVSRGGTMMRAAQALHLCGPWAGSVRPSVASLKHLAIKIAELLEQTIPGHYAELGIDLGIDVNGRIWLLEINSKPSKALNTLQPPEVPEGAEGAEPPEVPRKARPSVRRLFDYSSYLSGFILKKKTVNRARVKLKRKS